MSGRFLLQLLCILLVAVGLAVITSRLVPERRPIYREVQIPVEKIVEVERVDTVVTTKERVLYRTPRAVTVATAAGGGRADVERFCPATPVDTTGINKGSAAIVNQPALLIRSVRLSDGWYFARDRLTLTGPLSTGDLAQYNYRTRGSFQAHVHADSVLVQYPRGALLQQLVEFGSALGVGFVLGRTF